MPLVPPRSVTKSVATTPSGKCSRLAPPRRVSFTSVHNLAAVLDLYDTRAPDQLDQRAIAPALIAAVGSTFDADYAAASAQ